MRIVNPGVAEPQKQSVSKVKLALGAASLFLFIVGIKRTYRRGDDGEVVSDGDDFESGGGRARGATAPRRIPQRP
jgi:hypothetical protein